MPWNESASTQFHTFPRLPLTSGMSVASRKKTLEKLITCAKAVKEGRHLRSYLSNRVENLIFNHPTLLCF